MLVKAKFSLNLVFDKAVTCLNVNSDLQAGIWFGSVALSPIITFWHSCMMHDAWSDFGLSISKVFVNFREGEIRAKIWHFRGFFYFRWNFIIFITKPWHCQEKNYIRSLSLSEPTWLAGHEANSDQKIINSDDGGTLEGPFSPCVCLNQSCRVYLVAHLGLHDGWYMNVFAYICVLHFVCLKIKGICCPPIF